MARCQAQGPLGERQKFIPKTMPQPDVKRFVIPARFGFGVKVPEGGSSCATCFYVSKDGKSCNNALYRKYQGTSDLGANADAFCCAVWIQKDVGDLVPENERL